MHVLVITMSISVDNPWKQ